MNVWDGFITAGKTHTFSVPVGHNSLLVVMSGNVSINATHEVGERSVVIFDQADVYFELTANSDAKFLVLTGEPLNEPIEGYGPFVMNSKKEIIEAIHDFNNGKFGRISTEAQLNH